MKIRLINILQFQVVMDVRFNSHKQQQKSYDKEQINKFYQDRAKFNHQAKNLFGFNLHDLSKSSNEDHFQSSQSIKKKKSGILDQVFNQIDQVSEKQRLIKENLDLKNKLLELLEDNKSYKYKANLWEKTKSFIENQFPLKIGPKSYGLKISDSSLLDEFLVEINRMVNRPMSDSKNQLSLFSEVSSSRAVEREEELTEKNIKLTILNDKLVIENNMLKEKIESLNENRKKKFDEIQSNISERFTELQNQNIEKKIENQGLKAQLQEFKAENTRLNSKLAYMEAHRSSNTKNQDELSIEFLNKKLKIRQEEINTLKEEIYNANISKQDANIINGKLKRLIQFAAQMNEEFLHQLQKNIKTSEPPVRSQYFNHLASKNNRSPQFKENRYKISKSKSLGKKSQSRLFDFKK